MNLEIEARQPIEKPQTFRNRKGYHRKKKSREKKVITVFGFPPKKLGARLKVGTAIKLKKTMSFRLMKPVKTGCTKDNGSPMVVPCSGLPW